MKFATTAAAATVLATSASAQLSSPLQLLQTASQLLTAECRTAVTGLAVGSDLSQCLQLNNLLPILQNTDSSVVPDVNAYLVDLCAAEACDQSTIDQATQLVTSACSTDLQRLKISEDMVRFAMNAYPTAREVACLSTNDTELVNANMSMMSMDNSTTEQDSESVLCPTALLYKAEAYLGVNFTNTYIDSLLLGANATAYQQLLAIPRNGSAISEFACNDCVAAGLQVVLRDYPELEDKTFDLSLDNVEQYTNYTLEGVEESERDNNTWTVARLYEGFCDVEVMANSTLPASINSTAYNATESTEEQVPGGVVTLTTTVIPTTTVPSTPETTSAAPIEATSAPSTAVATPVESATSIVQSVVQSILPIPSQVISELAGATPAPTRRWVKWD